MWTKIEILDNIQILDKTRNFRQNSKFWTKIKILDKNLNLKQTSKFRTKIENLDENQNFEQKSKFWTKLKFLDKNKNFGQKSKIWMPKFVKPEILGKIRNFCQKYGKFKIWFQHLYTFWAVPMLVLLTFWANRSVLSDSLAKSFRGLRCVIIKVFALPPREFCNKWVN